MGYFLLNFHPPVDEYNAQVFTVTVQKDKSILLTGTGQKSSKYLGRIFKVSKTL